MKNSQSTPSDTYKFLYYNIIEELLFQICNSNINYCVERYIGDDEFHIAIWKNFEKYKEKALLNMGSERLDRHKLASCICGAIVETKPLVGYNGAKIRKNANEIFALYVGLNVIKYYMMYDFIEGLNLSLEEKMNVHNYLKSNFDIAFPSSDENICDVQEYKENLINALYWTHDICDISQKECFRYDIWAYSKLFYHLEIYNKPIMKDVYKNFGVENSDTKEQEIAI